MGDLQAIAQQVQRRAHAARPRATVDLPLPLHAGALAARFGLCSEQTLEAFEDLAQRDDVSSEEGIDVALEFIADACRQVLSVNGKDVEPLTHTDGRPVRFDKGFAAAFALEPVEESMAAVVREVWRLEDGTLNQMALQGFGTRLLTWMQDTSSPVEGELVGESRGGAPSTGSGAPPRAESPQPSS